MSASSKKKLRKEQNAAMLTEKQQAEQKEAKKLKTYTLIFTVVIALVLVSSLVIMAVTAFNNSGITEKNTVVLTVDDHKVTAAEMTYFFVDSVFELYNQWYSTYGDYAASYMAMFMGLDLTKPLDQQIYDNTTGQTYGEYLAEGAVTTAVSTYRSYDLAKKAGYTLTEDETAAIEASITDLKTTAAQNGFSSVSDYLKAYYGNGSSEASYRSYLEVRAYASRYINDTYEGFTYSQEDLDAYNAEHFDDFSSFSYLSFTVDVDDFVVCTAKEDDEEHEHTAEELAAAVEAAEKAANALSEAKPTTAEEFNAAIKSLDVYAEKANTSCSVLEDLSLEEIYNDDITEWIVGDLKAGDLTVFRDETTSTDDSGVETTTVNSFTVVVFQSRNDNNDEMVDVRHILAKYEGGTTDENGNTTYSDAEKQAAYNRVKGVCDTWLAGEATEDTFAELAKLNSDDGSAEEGGLIDNIYPGSTVTNFNDWCFDEERKPGDYEIVETEFGYHLIYFIGKNGVTYRNHMIENTMRNDEYTAWYESLSESAPYEVGDLEVLPLSKTFFYTN